MIVQTKNSTYILQWMGPPMKGPKRWALWRYEKAAARDVKNYARNLGQGHYEGDTLTLGIGSPMVLMRGGQKIIETSLVEDIE